MEAGRSCPLHYRYQPEALDRPPALVADTLYVVGGLYGNLEALQALSALLAREPAGAGLVFNGDFHWFDVDPGDFALVNRQVLTHAALRGNVETELADPSGDAGCGCAYPETVAAAVVERSNRIMARLQQTAAGFPDLQAQLRALPPHLTARVGGVRVGIVHGDAHSLAGWDFDESRLPSPSDPLAAAAQAENFRRANVQLFASSHTCLPCAQDYLVDGQVCAVINNGAAGMPNFAGDLRGVVTRLSVHPPAVATLYGRVIDGVHVSAVPLSYDIASWQRRFLRQWPAGSAAHASYFERISRGPAYELARAARGGFMLGDGGRRMAG